VVGTDVPPLNLLQPGGDADHVGDQVRIVCPAIRRRDEGDDMHSEAEELGEPPEFSSHEDTDTGLKPNY